MTRAGPGRGETRSHRAAGRRSSSRSPPPATRERVGRAEEVIVESPSRTDPSLLRGRTRRNTTVNFSGSAALAGDLVDVRIEGATSTTLRGVQAVPVAA